MKSQACQPGSWTGRDQPIDFRANPISPQLAALRTEIIPMGYVQWALYFRFVVHDLITKVYKKVISNAGYLTNRKARVVYALYCAIKPARGGSTRRKCTSTGTWLYLFYSDVFHYITSHEVSQYKVLSKYALMQIFYRPLIWNSRRITNY